MHCASSKRASVSESSDFSRSLRAGADVGAGVGVGVPVPVVEETDDAAGAAPDYSVNNRNISINKIYTNYVYSLMKWKYNLIHIYYT